MAASIPGLRVGLEASLQEIQSLWLRHNNSVEKESKVLDAKLPRKSTGKYCWKSVCSSAPRRKWKESTDSCRAHLFCSGDSMDSMKVDSVSLDHTCSGDSEQKRKRNYSTSTLKTYDESQQRWNNLVPTRLRSLTFSRMFNQSAEWTWDAYKNFDSVPVPGATVTIVQGDNNTVGCIRRITYPNGVKVSERLLAHVGTGPMYSLAYDFPEPMLGVKQFSGNWIVKPAGTDGTRSEMIMYLVWEPNDEESNETFERNCITLLQNGFLSAADPPTTGDA